MKLQSLGSQPQIKVAELSCTNGVRVLFSYGQPVAAFKPGVGYIRTDQFLSKTTERHIEMWVGALFKADPVPQSTLDNILGGMLRP